MTLIAFVLRGWKRLAPKFPTKMIVDLRFRSPVFTIARREARRTVSAEGDGIDLTKTEVHVDAHGLPQPSPANATVRPTADGMFQFPKLSRGVYDLSVTSLPKGAYVKSARLGDVDLIANGLAVDADEVGPVEVVLAMGAPSITGTTDPGAKVVLVPEGAERRARKSLYRVADAGQGGSFSMEGLLPGRYKLFAWEEVEDTAWLNADFLKDYEETAMPVLLEPGSSVRVDLR